MLLEVDQCYFELFHHFQNHAQIKYHWFTNHRMLFVNAIVKGTRNTIQMYMNGTRLNGILNDLMVFWIVLIRSSSLSVSMALWIVFGSESQSRYHWRRYWRASYKYHLQNTIGPFRIHSVKYYSDSLGHNTPLYHSNTIQILLNCEYTFT